MNINKNITNMVLIKNINNKFNNKFNNNMMMKMHLMITMINYIKTNNIYNNKMIIY